MAKEPELKARDKVVMKMTRDCAVEENLTVGTSKSITGRAEDAELVKPAELPQESKVPSLAEQKKVQVQRQMRRFQEQQSGNADSQAEPEKPVREDKSPEAPPQAAQEMPFSADAPLKPLSPVQHGVPKHTGTIIAEAVVTHKLRKTSPVKNVDADAVLSKAAETDRKSVV